VTGSEPLGLDYAGLPGLHDEMLGAPGTPRPHWQALVRSLHALGGAELARRWEVARRLIHENGVTYNVYGDPRGMDRPWALDPIPLVSSEPEWAPIRTALAQRARLLDAILADLYGAQRLLREGLLPPELVFAHPTYLRPCHGVQLPPGGWLQLYAADLARSADGQWWVLADRTQAPSGAGYALENRLVVSRTLPEAFRESQVERLADSSGACRTRCARSRRATTTIRAWRCSRPGPTTRPTSSTPISRATSASRWSRAATSPCATACCI
jgi:uncharacterized circularly permuted ATP-grasp superfamily protein